MGNFDIYLQPTEFFDFNKKFVREKAFEITAGLESTLIFLLLKLILKPA